MVPGTSEVAITGTAELKFLRVICFSGSQEWAKLYARAQVSVLGLRRSGTRDRLVRQGCVRIAALLNAAAEERGMQLKLKKRTVRSEERRVGKECRSRWS